MNDFRTIKEFANCIDAEPSGEQLVNLEKEAYAISEKLGLPVVMVPSFEDDVLMSIVNTNR